ncbi:hypothetical protein PZ938_14910 [Luteipulveratus sp. YIM 133132]|uniref:hypothetical protein n=1 Tax=Luteipulveratus flavus TaxID=3031728 RepID=UPI0023B0A7FB|nr:hypothetical protein [Luteipulveratus sp. YIM 133132]MDE9366904.1 hypothetical protein [Luteipulveratus sp. YIM 133132]
MTGTRLGRLSLGLDAAYCVVVGIMLGAAAPLIAGWARLPVALIVGVGALVAIWGVAVWWLRRRHHLRSALKVVMLANGAAVLALCGVSVAVGGVLLVVALIAAAVDVAGFGVSQAVALRRLEPSV